MGGHPLSDMMAEVRELIDGKGFSSDERRVWELFALLHSEISEAVDIYRRGGSHEEVGYELTDTLIRLLHLMSVIGLDPDRLYREVMDANCNRPARWNTVRGG